MKPIAYLRHRADETWKLYEADVANAQTNDERSKQESMRLFECSEYTDEIRRIESLAWIARAEIVHLSVYDIPSANEHEEHWETGPHGTRYLSDRVLRTLQKQVEDAEYERDRRRREGREIWIKYVTGGAAVLAAAASIANLILTAHRK
jgi:hypothetical protein